LGLALGAPVYVTAIDPDDGTVRVGPRAALLRAACEVGPVAWHARVPDGAAVLVQLRHHHQAVRARVALRGEERVDVRFEAPCDAVSPGQYAVFYDGERVLGGGRIRREALSAGSTASS
jgi:tRNA-specific 2-thiouridylase